MNWYRNYWYYVGGGIFVMLAIVYLGKDKYGNRLS